MNSKCNNSDCKFYATHSEFAINNCTFGASADDREEEKICEGDIKMNNTLYFAKVRPTAKIPTKRVEDAGYDLYVDTDKDYILLPPHSTTLLPTGIATCVSDDYYLQIVDRGSNGSKGLTYTAGVIDSGYRNEIFVAICNTNSIPYIISDLSLEELCKINDAIKRYLKVFSKPPKIEAEIGIYPMSKAIAQAVVLPVPKMNVQEISYEELAAIPSERGTGALGSSGK